MKCALFVNKNLKDKEDLDSFLKATGVCFKWGGAPVFNQAIELTQAEEIKEKLNTANLDAEIRIVQGDGNYLYSKIIPKDFDYSQLPSSFGRKFPTTLNEARTYFITPNRATQQALRLDNKLKDSSWFPCPACEGTTIEGFVGGIGYFQCPKCKGTGQTSKEKFEKFFTKKTTEYQLAQLEYERKQNRLADILNMLLDEDIDILADMYFKCCECGNSHTV